MHSEQRTVIDWIGTKQWAGDCASSYEVRDYASRLLSERSREDIALGKPEWWSLRKQHVQKLQVSTVRAREPARSALICEGFARDFRDVIDAA
jgi:hypothetical protein